MLCIFLLCGCVANAPVKDLISISYITDPAGLGTESGEYVVSAMDEIGEYFEFEKNVFRTEELSDVDSVVGKAVEKGSDLYIGTSYAVNHSLQTALREKDCMVAMIGTEPDEEYKNIISITFKMEEAAFMAGYLAACTTKSGVVAYIGAFDSEDTEQYYGFYAGAKYKDKDIVVVSAYTESYNNSVRGKTAAESVKREDADVYYVNCGSCALGVAEIVAGSEVRLILSDEYTVKNDEVIAGSVQYVKNAAFYVVDEFLNEQLRPGVYRYGVSYGFVDLQVENSVDEKIRSEMSTLRNGIRTSKIKVPSTKEETDAFLGVAEQNEDGIF